MKKLHDLTENDAIKQIKELAEKHGINFKEL